MVNGTTSVFEDIDSQFRNREQTIVPDSAGGKKEEAITKIKKQKKDFTKTIKKTKSFFLKKRSLPRTSGSLPSGLVGRNVLTGDVSNPFVKGKLKNPFI